MSRALLVVSMLQVLIGIGLLTRIPSEADFCPMEGQRSPGGLGSVLVTFWHPGHGFKSRREWVFSHFRTWG